MIAKLLGDPDQTKQNPHYRKAPPMKLYSPDRVEKAEATDTFCALKEAAQRRSKVGKRTATRRRNALLAEVQAEPLPTLPELTQQALTHRACAAYNAMWWDRGDYSKHASPHDDAHFLCRISRNYARHCLTQYETRLEKLTGKIGKAEAYGIIKDRINEAIDLAYPWLTECRE